MVPHSVVWGKSLGEEVKILIIDKITNKLMHLSSSPCVSELVPSKLGGWVTFIIYDVFIFRSFSKQEKTENAGKYKTGINPRWTIISINGHVFIMCVIMFFNT